MAERCWELNLGHRWHRWKGERLTGLIRVNTDLDEGEGRVRGDSKVSIGMSEWLVIPLREKG